MLRKGVLALPSLTGRSSTQGPVAAERQKGWQKDFQKRKVDSFSINQKANFKNHMIKYEDIHSSPSASLSKLSKAIWMFTSSSFGR